ncbi:hypothetical protein TNCV_379411 [Trichonephila clavipes]|nr:hypothetical protein TNCV_379411 [Trichonephila clavipes]
MTGMTPGTPPFLTSTPTEGRLSLDIFNMHQPLLHDGSSEILVAPRLAAEARMPSYERGGQPPGVNEGEGIQRADARRGGRSSGAEERVTRTVAK